MSRHLIILGSARGDGNTAALARAVHEQLDDASLIDLNELRIAPYSYDGRNAGDDFVSIAKAMNEAETIIFASPVYWYSMSGVMKDFFDRLTDLTDPPLKPIGKSLAGKRVFLIATGNSPEPPPEFEPPFEKTSHYFNMTYGGMLYGRGNGIDPTAVEHFINCVTNSKMTAPEAEVKNDARRNVALDSRL